MQTVIVVEEGFWNLRGSFKIGGLLDIGTQMSLVRRANGRYILLDACALGPESAALINDKTRGGADLEAVLHLHPFHTIHVQALHERYPKAKLYGTARHRELSPSLPWEALRVEDPALHAQLAEDLEFTVPRGVDFISANPKIHFSSVLAIHRATQTLHVDDTIMYLRLPLLLRFLGQDATRLHITLAQALRPEAGAAAEFRRWARELIERAATLRNLCAAHSAVLLARDNRGPAIAARLEDALRREEGKLRAHEKKYG